MDEIVLKYWRKVRLLIIEKVVRNKRLLNSQLVCMLFVKFIIITNLCITRNSNISRIFHDIFGAKLHFTIFIDIAQIVSDKIAV